MRVVCVVLLAVAAACSRERKGPAYAEQVADAIPRLERTMGLKFKTPPKFEMRSRDEVRQFLEEAFATDLPEASLRGQDRLYKRMGLLPDSLDLKKFMIDLLTEQIAGYYNPKTKVLYIVQGASDQMVAVTVMHELVHALQDQYAPLDSLTREIDRADKVAAIKSVIEGQAFIEQLNAMSSGAMDLDENWNTARDAVREGYTGSPVFGNAPFLLQETMLFPYLTGGEFYRRARGTNARKFLLSDPPVSSEQVLHPAKFLIDRDDPTVVKLPPVTGADAFSGELGEFETRLFLFQHLKDRDAAYRGAAGWDGDKFTTFTTGRGDGMAWLSVWDTSVDAAEFLDLVDTALLKRFDDLKPGQSSASRRTFTARGRTIAVSAVEIQGRPCVMYVDVPAGSSIDVIDIKKVVLEE